MKRYKPEHVRTLLQQQKQDQNNIQYLLCLIEIHRLWHSLPSEVLRTIPITPRINAKAELILQCPNASMRTYIQGQLKIIHEHFAPLLEKLNVKTIRIEF